MPAPTPPPPAPSGSAYEPAAVEEKWYRFWEEGGFFHADPDAVNREGKPSFVIPMPPPNVTGRLHMGHALQDTVQDLLIRYKRMQGFEALWIPGIDHAGIATQNVVERTLKADGVDRKAIGREAFLEHVWDWKEEYGDIILQQKRRLGDSCDWRYSRFTMDAGFSRAVQDVFVRLHEAGLIYKGDYLVNWDPENQTVISNEEVDNVERDGHLWWIRYPYAEGDGHLTIATTRPETLLADTAVAVHPDDERYQSLVGKDVLVPLVNRRVPVIADDYVKPEFGAGALKVTPGHDENDFAIGKRHGLETISVMALDGSIASEADLGDAVAYAGLDRFAARKAIVADLDAAGLLEKTEPYRHTVPISSRSKGLIEPLISPQWYVKMKPLADEALKVVRDGTVTFYPDRWKNEYFRWLEDIRDWPISRQLWWGHRIPVWYHEGEDGQPDLSRDYVVAVDCPEPGMIQDEDVLDTWFSSWLWPFATLGWPQALEGGDAEGSEMAGPAALKAFYPGDVLVSGYDILFFWIARMVMAGQQFTRQVPFRDVFITGMIKDKQGRWMSKSLGNGIDPLDTIEEYGADAVRYTLAELCAQGQDIKLDPSRFAGGRNFANKIWNASRVFGRFMETDEDGRPSRNYLRERPDGDLSLVERWLLTRITETVEAVNAALERYRISEAASLVYDLVWRDFCDWYLELAKPGYDEGGTPTEMDRETIAFSVEVFEQLLLLLHPLMPFLTEELWWTLRPRSAADACIAAAWPEPSFRDPEAAATFGLVQEIVSAVRSVRSQYNVPPSRRIAVTVSTGGRHADKDAITLGAVRGYVERLAGVEALTVGASLEKPPASAAVVVGRHEVFLPLAGMIDLDQERDRLRTEIADKTRFLESVERKLQNEQFVSRAPEAVVAKERQKAADARAQIEALNANLQDLG